MNTEGSAGVPAVAQVVRMSLRPTPRFAPGTDLDLWITRFEMYLKQANIAEDQWTVELLPMLDDEPFRTVLCQGLSASSQYKADRVFTDPICTRRQRTGVAVQAAELNAEAW